jgi:phosphoglycolate phosphatase
MARPHEENFRKVVDPKTVASRFLPGSGIEVVGGFGFLQPPRHALFDFDGTLSLIREGWPEIMIPMMVELLQQTGTGESEESLTQLVTEFVMELNGKQTIYQMIRLAEEIQKRGGTPLEPLAYKQEYNSRLMARIESRREALRSQAVPPQDLLVPGSERLLELLQSRGLRLYLASGTDEGFVKEEVELLGLDQYFGAQVYGALDDYRSFSKAQVIERILTQNAVDGGSLVGFGDGYVEIQNVRDAGGIAVAVASDEKHQSGRPDAWKRERLIAAGAHLVIPDYQEADRLVAYLLDCRETPPRIDFR